MLPIHLMTYVKTQIGVQAVYCLGFMDTTWFSRPERLYWTPPRPVAGSLCSPPNWSLSRKDGAGHGRARADELGDLPLTVASPRRLNRPTATTLMPALQAIGELLPAAVDSCLTLLA